MYIVQGAGEPRTDSDLMQIPSSKGGRLLLLLGLGIALVAAPVEGAIIHIPGDFSTIQQGIDASVDGDTVLIADGRYTGPGNRDIDFGGRAILITSEHGPEKTGIDCERQGRGFVFHSGEGPGSILRGLTIRKGKVPLIGAGILCLYSSPTIEECIITLNETEHGAGIFVGYGSPTITRNWIEANLSTGG